MLNFKSSLAVEITKELMTDERTSDGNIEVVDDNGVVTLTGTATSDEARVAAEEIAREHDGTVSVINDLKIKAKSRGLWPFS